jgi:hypothetical protein
MPSRNLLDPAARTTCVVVMPRCVFVGTSSPGNPTVRGDVRLLDVEVNMGIGVGLFLFAAGAILTFAVDKTVSGLDISTVGVILMVVGGVAILLSTLFWASWSPGRRRETVVYEDRRGDLL